MRIRIFEVTNGFCAYLVADVARTTAPASLSLLTAVASSSDT